MAKEAYYFSHDSNAKTDEKILELRAELGWEGYGIFWAVIESLRDSEGYKYSRNRLAGLAISLGVIKEYLERIIYDFDLFKFDDENFWSQRLLRSMEKKEELSKRRSEYGSLKGKQSKTKASKKHKQSISSALPEQGKESKVKEIKEENEEKNIKKENQKIPPELSDVTEYFTSKIGATYGLPTAEREAIKFFNFYKSKGWMVGKNPMKSWVGAAGGWIARDEPNFRKGGANGQIRQSSAGNNGNGRGGTIGELQSVLAKWDEPERNGQHTSSGPILSIVGSVGS